MNHPVRIMLPVTDTPTTSILDRFADLLPGLTEGVHFEYGPDGRPFPIVRGGADGDEEEQEEQEEQEEENEASVEFTPEQQAKIDKIVADAKAKAAKSTRTTVENEIKTLGDREKMDAAERAKAEKADIEKAASDRVSAADKRVINAELKAAALAAGVKSERLSRFLRNVDADDIEVDDDGNVDDAAVTAAVAAALKDVPEFASSGEPPTTGGAEHQPNGKKKTWTREEISKLSPAEFSKHEDEIMAQMAGAGIK